MAAPIAEAAEAPEEPAAASCAKALEEMSVVSAAVASGRVFFDIVRGLLVLLFNRGSRTSRPRESPAALVRFCADRKARLGIASEGRICRGNQ